LTSELAGKHCFYPVQRSQAFVYFLANIGADHPLFVSALPTHATAHIRIERQVKHPHDRPTESALVLFPSENSLVSAVHSDGLQYDLFGLSLAHDVLSFTLAVRVLSVRAKM
jgi:hypothetical protein